MQKYNLLTEMAEKTVKFYREYKANTDDNLLGTDQSYKVRTASITKSMRQQDLNSFR